MSLTRVVTMAAFVAAGLAFVLLEWRARRPGSALPTLGDVAGFVMRFRAGRVPVGRIAVYGFWWWIGWHFFAR